MTTLSLTLLLTLSLSLSLSQTHTLSLSLWFCLFVFLLSTFNSWTKLISRGILFIITSYSICKMSYFLYFRSPCSLLVCDCWLRNFICFVFTIYLSLQQRVHFILPSPSLSLHFFLYLSSWPILSLQQWVQFILLQPSLKNFFAFVSWSHQSEMSSNKKSVCNWNLSSKFYL